MAVKPIILDDYRKYIKDSCERCGSTTHLNCHHKDFNHNNNREENIQTLCRTCHMGTHALARLNKGIQRIPKEKIIGDKDYENITTIQIKDKTGASRAMTIHGTNVIDEYNRLYFLYDELSKSVTDYVTIKHYRLKRHESEEKK
jgi:hypothetical protein